MKKVIKSVNLVCKDYSVKNYKQFVESSSNLLFDKNGIYKTYGYQKSGIKASQNVDYAYEFEGKIYERADGYLYLRTPSTNKLLCTVGNGALSFAQTIRNATRTLLVISDNGVFLISGQTAVRSEWVSAEVATEHGGRLFTAKDRVITFSDRFDFEKQNVKLTVHGTLRVDRSSGDVIGFLSKNDKLFVICQKAIYLLKDGENSWDFNFRKVNFLQFEIDAKSFVNDNGKVYFVSDGKVYSFDGENIDFHSDFLQTLKGYEKGYAGFNDGVYFVCLKNKTDFLYLCDIHKNLDGIVPITCGVTSNGWAVVGDEYVKFYKDEECLGKCQCKSKKLILSQKGQADLCEITLVSGGQAKLTVHSGSGRKNFSLKEGANRFNFMLGAQWFQFEFSAEKSCSFSDLSLKYYERGD